MNALEARAATVAHIRRVQVLLHGVITDLLRRSETHDETKLESPEVEVFDEYTQRLKGITYDSKEYKQCLAEMKSALDHHYLCNSHHPEHFIRGVDDMDLCDLLEMLADWRAASERHADGDIYQSIQKNTERFKLSPQLVRILCNTVGRRV